ncbi:MFS transporter [Limibacter armeniacum]|uniref:MFS transporter n=1 Tax=Limibacter armeniacum TaxID=466084 RepID=UPI002FE528FC
MIETKIPKQKASTNLNPWSWVPSLYFIQGIPYIVVMSVAVTMYKTLNISNTEIALYTSWLYLPWVIKPLWSPMVDVLRTKRWWTWTMQLLIGGAFAGVAFTLPMDSFFQYSLAMLWLVAFSSATHDIAADGFYMLGLRDDQQAFFVGIRSTFYRLAMLTGQGAVVYIAGTLATNMGDNFIQAWALTFGGIAVVLIGFSLYHAWILPKPEKEEVEQKNIAQVMSEFGDTFISFFQKPGVWIGVAFILLYRLGEAQLVKLATPFLLDERAVGGLEITAQEQGIIYGTVGVAFLTAGGILGGYMVSQKGLKFWLWWMLLSLNLPNGLYILLSLFQPESLYIIGAAVAIEQFFYGFGFTALMMYMIYISDGEHKTAHYALCTGFMALGMMLPGMASGWIQEAVGYTSFFTIVLVLALPGFVVARYVKVDPAFGRKDK